MAITLRVKELRLARGWSQDELAQRAGITRVTVTRIEGDRNRRLDYDVLEKLADAFEVDPGLLIRRERHAPIRAAGARASARASGRPRSNR